MQKILVYCWGSICEDMVINAFRQQGYETFSFRKKMKDYHADAEFAKEFIELLHEEKPNLVFSYNYFPLISMICQMNQIPYASWIYDCPQYTLLSKTFFNDYNYIFCFDEIYTKYLMDMGGKKVLYFPLGCDVNLYSNVEKSREDDYVSDISFVGNLYNNSKNRILHAQMEEYEKGYIEGLIRTQLRIYGYNFIKDSLSKEVAEKIIKECNLSLGENYNYDSMQLASDAIGMEVSSRERQKDHRA